MAESSKKKSNSGEVSKILKEFVADNTKTTVTLKEFKEAISERSYGLLMFFFALPCIIPIPTPGLSAVVGLPLLIIAFQMAIGLKSPWLPKFLSHKKVKMSQMKKVCNWVVPYLEKLEVVLRPRLDFLVKPPAERVIAVICFFMAVMILFPIPFGNAIPALAICLFSLAILTSDGLLAIIAFIVFLISLAVASAFVDVIVSTVESIF